MRIGIDAHTIGYHQVSGNQTYASNLIKAFGDIDSKNEYYLYITNPKVKDTSLFQRPNFHTRLVQESPWFRLPFSFPMELFRYQVDLAHFQYVAPPICPCRFVVTIHDLSFELFPSCYTRKHRLWATKLVPFTVRRAERIFTVSEYSKKTLIDLYHIPPEKIIVTYNGVDTELFRIVEDPGLLDEVRKRYKISDKFILCIGRLEPRKNLPRLIKAFAELKKDRAIEHKLVIAGQKDFLYTDIFKSVKELGLEEEVVFTGLVAPQDLPLLYNAADLFVYPSIFEGFGLGVIEAMACGTPVICSNTSSLPEVAGGAGILVDPYNVEAIARAIKDVLTVPGLRNKLAQKGIAQAKKFSWYETAHRTLSVYEEVYSGRN